MPSFLTCSACGFAENSVRARFCGACAQPLPQVCPACQAVNPPGFRFCSQCATPLGSQLRQQSTRRVVTVLFVDVCNSTALTNELGAERMYSLLDPCLRRLSETVRRFEGSIDKFTGDGLMAVFGMPTALEQHAVQAAYTALAMFDELKRYNDSIQGTEQVTIQLRIGLASGEVIAGRLGSDRLSDTTVIGDVVNLAARLQQHANPNQILINDVAAQLAASVFEIEERAPASLKGYTNPVAEFCLINKRSTTTLLRGSSAVQAPLFGRADELRQLEEATLLLESTMGGAVCIVGEAGIGKSRLTHELLERISTRAITVYEGDCSSATRIVPYSVFIGVVRDMCGINATDQRDTVRQKINLAVRESGVEHVNAVVPYLEYLLSIELVDEQLLKRIKHLEPAQLKQQVFLALRTLITAQTKLQPVLLVLDDLQWIDELSIEVIAMLADLIDTAPLMLYLVARDEYPAAVQTMFDQVAAKAAQRGLSLALGHLDQPALQQMVRALIPFASDSVVEQLAEYADGIPFYLEELVHHILEVGVDLQAAEAESLSLQRIPLSLEALLRARYDRLPPALQDTLALAATIGRRFSVTLLQALDSSPDLPQRLTQLRDRALVRPRRSNSNEWTFQHLLMQETVYNSLLSDQRRDLHGAIGLTLEQLAGDRIDEQVETLAFHFARSEQLPKAVYYGILSAERAAGRYANDDALRSYASVATLLEQLSPPDWHAQATIAYGRAAVLTHLGRYGEARDACMSGLATVVNLQPQDPNLHSALERQVALVEEKQGNYAEAAAHLDHARDVLGDGDLLDHANIDAAAGWLAFMQEELVQAERLLLSALTIAETYDHTGLQTKVLNRLAGIEWRRGNLAKASALVFQSLEMSQRLNDIGAVARAYNNLGILAVEGANWTEAVEYYNRSMAAYVDTNDISGQIQTAVNQSIALMMQGQLDAALRLLRMAYSLSRQIGDRLHMAYALFHQGRISFFAEDLLRARRYFIEAECIYREIGGHVSNRADIAENLARIAWCNGRSKAAQRLLQRTTRLALLSGERIAMYRAERLRAFLALHAGQLTEVETVLEHLHTQPAGALEQAELALVTAMFERERGNSHLALEAETEAQYHYEQARIPPLLRRFI